MVLGSSSGFGEAACRRLAESGFNILGVHLDRKSGQAQADAIVSYIKGLGRECVFFNVNAADDLKRKEILTEVQSKCSGRIKVLLHSLAFGALKPLVSEDALTRAQIEMTLDVMANSLVYWAQDLTHFKLWSKSARIFAMTSAGSTRVWRSYGAVSAAKASLESYIRQLALELAPIGVTANAILAGVTDTPALRKIPGNAEMIEAATKRNPMGRLTTPDDVAQTLVSLCLPYCDFVTGNTLRIDGGENIVD